MNREDFPIFAHSEMVYLDSAATTQKPQRVIDAELEYYTRYCANTHRSSHGLGNRATQEYEAAREKVAAFIGAEAEEVVFTRGTTESINLVASSFVRRRYAKVIVSELEHHSNIVPWQLAGAELVVIPATASLEPDMEAYGRMVRENAGGFVAITHVCNVFGIVYPLKQMIETAHESGCTVLIDGAQAVAHMALDMKALDADFYAFSAHKMYGPTGVGVLYGKRALLEAMAPYQGGGTMIEKVTFAQSSFLPPPHRFEAGTQSIAQAIALGAAADYLRGIGFDAIRENDHELLNYANTQLQPIEGIICYTDSSHVAGNLSFNVEGVHHSDIGTLLDKQNVMLRTGHHCAMPMMQKLGIAGTVRLSFGIYNERSDIDRAIHALKRSLEILR